MMTLKKRQPMRKAITIGLAVALLGGLGFVALKLRRQEPSFREPALETSELMPDFTLRDQHGQPFRLSAQRGRVVLLFFGYTYCPDICPTTLAMWRQVHDALDDDAKRVRFVFITVDPERDTPERMGKHLAVFNPDFIGLTGPPDKLEPVYQAFDVSREKVFAGGSASAYLMNHTATGFVIDPDGQLRLSHGYFTPPEDIAHDIRQLLRE